VTSYAIAATEPRRLRKKSYRSLAPLGMAATFVRISNGHAQNAGPSRMHVVFSPTYCARFNRSQ
jgi:hypothetical protein